MSSSLVPFLLILRVFDSSMLMSRGFRIPVDKEFIHLLRMVLIDPPSADFSGKHGFIRIRLQAATVNPVLMNFDRLFPREIAEENHLSGGRTDIVPQTDCDRRRTFDPGRKIGRIKIAECFRVSRSPAPPVAGTWLSRPDRPSMGSPQRTP